MLYRRSQGATRILVQQVERQVLWDISVTLNRQLCSSLQEAQCRQQARWSGSMLSGA